MLRPGTLLLDREARNFGGRLIALQCYEITDKLLQLLGNHGLSGTGEEFSNQETRGKVKKAVDEIKQLKIRFSGNCFVTIVWRIAMMTLSGSLASSRV
jgi:hypothetical protein